MLVQDPNFGTCFKGVAFRYGLSLMATLLAFKTPQGCLVYREVSLGSYPNFGA